MILKSQFIEMFGDAVSNSKQWPTMDLISVAPITQDRKKSSDENWLLNLDAIESNSGRVLLKYYVKSDKLTGSICSFSTDCVLYSKLRPNLNKVVIPDEPGYGTTELLPMVPDKKILNQQYLARVLMSEPFVSKFSSAVAGTKMPRVSMDTLKKFQLPLPPLELQNQFADFVKQVDKSKLIIQICTKFHRAIKKCKCKIKMRSYIDIKNPIIKKQQLHLMCTGEII